MYLKKKKGQIPCPQRNDHDSEQTQNDQQHHYGWNKHVSAQRLHVLSAESTMVNSQFTDLPIHPINISEIKYNNQNFDYYNQTIIIKTVQSVTESIVVRNYSVVLTVPWVGRQ